MYQDTKVVFIHKGYSWFLPYALYNARSYNLDDVILLTDKESANTYKGIQLELFYDYNSPEVIEFKKNYKHMSTNSSDFEQFCWIRWFYLLNLMKRKNIQSVFYFDSDVLIYSSISDMIKCYSDLKLKCGFCIPKQDYDSLRWTASGHASFWTLDMLEAFCDFILKSFQKSHYMKLYEKKWAWHRSSATQGGICDMTTLFLFWKEKSDEIINLLKSHNGIVFDHSINFGSNYYVNQYQEEKRMKKFDFSGGVPYFFIRDSEIKERVFALHFQSGAKKYMPLYYRGNKFFPGRIKSDLWRLAQYPIKVGKVLSRLSG